jgi:hypothetical protein
LLDACDAFGGFTPADLLLVGIEAQRDPVIAKRCRKLALALIGLASIAIGIKILRKQPQRGVEFDDGGIVFALRQIVDTEPVVDAGAVGIEP